MDIIRPLQIHFFHQVLEQNRKFYFTATACLGVNLTSGEERLDLYYLKDAFEALGDTSLPDNGMPKPRGEFLVSGSFYAGSKGPVNGGRVKVRLGTGEKELFVFGPRQWQGGRPSEPERIESLALDYTHAFGGSGFEPNPDGMGFNDGRLPCIESPQRLVASKNDTPEPAGFAPLDPMRPQRNRYQGTYDLDYKKKYFPGHPEDMDWQFFMCGPKDQWTDQYFKGNESFGLYHMHPDRPAIEGRLPNLGVRCFINRAKEGFGELPMNLDTVWFFPEKELAMLYFRGVMEVGDDEAGEITHLMAGYEHLSCPPRTPDHYRTAFEKRRNSKDTFLKNFKTEDLIPDGHPTAMALLLTSAVQNGTDRPFADNMDAKSGELRQMADDQVNEAIEASDRAMADAKQDPAWAQLTDGTGEGTPGQDTGLNLKQLMADNSQPDPDPDLEELNRTLDSIIPGLSSGDPTQLDLGQFSFDKIDRILAATDELAKKKQAQALTLAGEELQKVKDQVANQAAQPPEDGMDADTGAMVRDQAKEAFKALEKIHLDGPGKTQGPLPRIHADRIMAEMDRVFAEQGQVRPELLTAMQQLVAMQAAGMDNDQTRQLEQDIRGMQDQILAEMDRAAQQVKEELKKAEKGFKQGYIMGAHFMEPGTSPHEDPPDKVSERFMAALETGEGVANGDWACIDLSGEILDGADLSGAFLEQVNFKGASLKGANLSGAILARADLEDADLRGADLTGANVGAVRGTGADFTGADFTGAKLSKGNFTRANFTTAKLADTELLEIVVDGANFTGADLSGLVFLEIGFDTVCFFQAALEGTIFLKCPLQNCRFDEGRLSGCHFTDSRLARCRFVNADMTKACFVATDPKQADTRDMDFTGACLKQANFQYMPMQKARFTGTDLENAFFGETDLTGADFSRARAKNAQFRKANLSFAVLDHINMDLGSLAKANLAGASFKSANLHGVDVLRANISNTDFSGANLDTTLIEKWRP